MDCQDIPYYRPVVAISSISRVWLWAISYKLSQIPSFDKVDYLFLQLEIIFSIVPLVFVKLAILVFVPLEEVGLDFARSLHKLFIFDLHELLSYGSIERR